LGGVYIEQHPGGYGYSRFCDLYRRWRRKLDVVLRQEHRAGEKMFVDYAGATIPAENPTTGEVRQAQIFVAVLGASSYSYAEATWKPVLTSAKCLPVSIREDHHTRRLGPRGLAYELK
jgi:transposase